MVFKHKNFEFQDVANIRVGNHQAILVCVLKTQAVLHQLVESGVFNNEILFRVFWKYLYVSGGRTLGNMVREFVSIIGEDLPATILTDLGWYRLQCTFY